MSEIILHYENPHRLEQFARDYARTGSLVTAVRNSGVQNPAYRIGTWGEMLLARQDVADWVSQEAALIAAEIAGRMNGKTAR